MGYGDETTWEPASKIPDDVLREYRGRHAAPRAVAAAPAAAAAGTARQRQPQMSRAEAAKATARRQL